MVVGVVGFVVRRGDRRRGLVRAVLVVFGAVVEVVGATVVVVVVGAVVGVGPT